MNEKLDDASNVIKNLTNKIMPQEECRSSTTSFVSLFSLISSAANSSYRLSPDNWKICTQLFNELYNSTFQNYNDSSDSIFNTMQIQYFESMLTDALPFERFLKDEQLEKDIFSLKDEQIKSLIVAVYSLSNNYIIPICSYLSKDQSKFLHILEKLQDQENYTELLAMLNSFTSQNANPSLAKKLTSVIFTHPKAKRNDSSQNLKSNSAMDFHTELLSSNQISSKFKKNNKTYSNNQFTLSDINFRNGCENLAKILINNFYDFQQRSNIVKKERIKNIKLALKQIKKDQIKDPELLDRVGNLADLFLSIQDPDAADTLLNFQNLLIAQPFTIAVAGESNVGKSSLVNLLLQDYVSPVSDIPSSYPPIVFRYGKKFNAEIFSFSKEQSRALQQMDLTAGTTFPRVLQFISGAKYITLKKFTDLSEFHNFLIQCKNSEIVFSHIEISFPADFLKDTTLVDVTGLNSSSIIEHSLAINTLLKCDCLVFIFSALRPITGLISNLLTKITESGRSDYFIPILTGADLLSSEISRNSVLSQTIKQLNAIKDSGIKLFEISMLDCRGISDEKNFLQFNVIKSYIEESRKFRGKSSDRIRIIGKAVNTALHTEVQKFYEKEISKIPDELYINILEKHLEHLESAIKEFSAHAYSTVNMAAMDIQAWEKEQDRAINAWHENVILKIYDAANNYADSLGRGMFKEKNWSTFNEKIVPKIAADSLSTLLSERRSVQKDWEKKFREFGSAIQKISLLCLDEFKTDLNFSQNDNLAFHHERWLVAARSLLEKAGLVTLGLALRRGGIGLGLVIGNIGWWSIIPIAFTGTLIWTLMKLGNPARCRQIYLDRKKKLITEWADKQKKRLQEVLNDSIHEITSNYSAIVQQSFNPAIKLLSEEALTIRLYLKILNKMKSDTEKTANFLLCKADELELSLLTSQKMI